MIYISTKPSLLAAGVAVSLLSTLTTGCGLAPGEGAEGSGGLLTSAGWKPIVNGQRVFARGFEDDATVDFEVGPARCLLTVRKARCEGAWFSPRKRCVDGEVKCTSPYALYPPPIAALPREPDHHSFSRQPPGEDLRAIINVGPFLGVLVLHFERKDGWFLLSGTYDGPDLEETKPPKVTFEEIAKELREAAGDVGSRPEPAHATPRHDGPWPIVDCWKLEQTKDDWPPDCWGTDCVYSWKQSDQVYEGACRGFDATCADDSFRTVRFGGILKRQFCLDGDWVGARDDESKYELIPCVILDKRYFGLTLDDVGECAENVE